MVDFLWNVEAAGDMWGVWTCALGVVVAVARHGTNVSAWLFGRLSMFPDDSFLLQQKRTN